MFKVMQKFLILSCLFTFKANAAPALKLSDPLPANLFVELAKAINPAVVNISTKTLPKFRTGQPRQGGDPFFDMLQQFYGLQMAPQQQRAQQALGTGFIIREDGLIVTNNHVIAGADLIQVQLTENSKLYDAKLIGSDERTDIALIKIESKEKLPVAELGSSKSLEVGEWVAAFGNPFGNGHTMTKGIVSAKGRDLGEINKFPLLQTDTPINPGNSGGPLVNTKGLVVGVNSAIDARAQGIGFAIPIDEVKSIIPQLEKNGKIRKGYLGVGLGDIDEQAAQYLGLKEAKGAVIMQVEKGSPAAQGGLRSYDVVTELNGKKINNSTELRDQVGDLTDGAVAKIKVLREGKQKSIDVTIGNAKENRKQTSQHVKKYIGQKAPMELGFMLTDPNETIAKEFSLPDDIDKPVIIDVTPESPAARAGLRPGDVLLDVNRKEISKTTDALKQFKQGANIVRILRGDGVGIVVLQ